MRAPIHLPALSPTMTKGSIARWLKAPGDRIEAGEPLLEIETDKATLEVEAVDDGILAEILLEAGGEAPVGAPIGWLEVESDGAPESEAAAEDGSAPRAGVGPAARKLAREGGVETARIEGSGPKRNVTKADVLDFARTAGGSTRTIASPYAKKLARQRGVSLEGLRGAGPGGRILASDVPQEASKRALVEKRAPQPGLIAPAPAPRPRREPVRKPLSAMRRAIAKRLAYSKQQIPHFYLHVDVELDRLLGLRAELNDLERFDTKISVNDMIVKAAASATREEPALNARFEGDAILQLATIDVAIAVALPDGLVTPIVEDADLKDLGAIARESKALAAAARRGALEPRQYEGGSFTISNLGMYGVSGFSAIINPPHAAILTVGAAQKRVAPAENGELDIASVASFGLAADHRVIDGARGASWLAALKKALENPLALVV